MQYILTFHPDGRVGAIYSDQIVSLLRELGETEIRRASDVEPDGAGWSAWIRDWVPGGATKLGPFPTRTEALVAEVAYLSRAFLR